MPWQKLADGSDTVFTMQLQYFTQLLIFWERSAKQYPVLAAVAEIYLAMSSSSVSVEAMFSTTGIVMNSKRAMLAPEKLHRISFIHDNISFLL